MMATLLAVGAARRGDGDHHGGDGIKISQSGHGADQAYEHDEVESEGKRRKAR